MKSRQKRMIEKLKRELTELQTKIMIWKMKSKREVGQKHYNWPSRGER